MTKVVYNGCFGGFSLSEAGVMRYAEIKGIKLYPKKDRESGWMVTYWTVPEIPAEVLQGDAWHTATPEQRKASNDAWNANTMGIREFDRDDPVLVQVVEELGDKANGMCAELRIEEIPAGTLYRIDEYDGRETIATQDSYEWKVAS